MCRRASRRIQYQTTAHGTNRSVGARLLLYGYWQQWTNATSSPVLLFHRIQIRILAQAFVHPAAALGLFQQQVPVAEMSAFDFSLGLPEQGEQPFLRYIVGPRPPECGGPIGPQSLLENFVVQRHKLPAASGVSLPAATTEQLLVNA